MEQLSIQQKTRKKQAELLSMIKDVDVFFKESGVEYSLCGGTLLGAIREKGFIPWDDDIDIMVNRENYEKMQQAFTNWDNNKYALNRYLWIDRIQRREDSPGDLNAPTIDVFVMDNCPDNEALRIAKIALIALLQGMMKDTVEYKGKKLPFKVCLFLTHLLGAPISNKRKFQWFHNVSKIGNKNRTKYMTGYNDAFNLLKLQYPGNLMDELIEVDFEDTILPVTKEYDLYLTTQYGNYMIPPKEEDRVPAHVL